MTKKEYKALFTKPRTQPPAPPNNLQDRLTLFCKCENYTFKISYSNDKAIYYLKDNELNVTYKYDETQLINLLNNYFKFDY